MADATSVAFTLSMDANVHHAGDVLAATQEIAGCLLANAGTSELVSLVVLDEDDNTAAAMTFYFFNADATLGVENAAVSISDADARKIVGTVVVPAAAWLDLILSKVAVIPNIGLLLKGAGASTSLWMGVSTAGTPTPSVNGITGHLTFIRY